ncbi:hypothetical protein HF086_017652 [Spodoptera exigua]|uniref:Endonuclease/exonuclease/phosphatase domain-containing protein n=1 Tax=Spodoptera exigua TaxID=7107 RepID=A0A922MNB6_SPOEX|nr:hypothetical protein HF086_017652 [Spodoptera exigua]
MAILCVYSPPSIRFDSAKLKDLINNIPKPCIIMGDFNAHNIAFGCHSDNNRGRCLFHIIDECNLCILNDGSPTTVPYPNRQASAIDLALVSSSIAHLYNRNKNEQSQKTNSIENAKENVPPEVPEQDEEKLLEQFLNEEGEEGELEQELDEEILDILGVIPNEKPVKESLRAEIAGKWAEILEKGLQKKRKKNPPFTNCPKMVVPTLNKEVSAALNQNAKRRDMLIELRQKQVYTSLSCIEEKKKKKPETNNKETERRKTLNWRGPPRSLQIKKTGGAAPKRDDKKNEYEIEIFSNASLSGWGASCETQRTGAAWTEKESGLHINSLELLAAFFGLKCFASSFRDCNILLGIDNVTAVSYINRLGDFESRKQLGNTEWELNNSYFDQIISYSGKPSIDLFASRTNKNALVMCLGTQIQMHIP